MNWIRRVVDNINSFIPTKTDPWWGWALALFGFAVLCIAASILVYPEGTEEELWLFGMRFGGECGMKTQFGIPCPQCGMTRSWVWLVRGDFGQSFFYNPAGFLLLCWIAIGGIIGLARLVRRNPTLWSPPWVALFVWSMFWIIVPYMGLYFARIAGISPLPEFGPSVEVEAQSSSHN